MFWQRTIRTEIESTGIGLHSGKKVKIALKPAPPNTGVVFRRTDIDGFELKANENYLSKTNRATSIGKGDIFIDTVEHLMAAFVGTGIDNIIVELNSSEVPVMDGSASPYLYLIQEAGIKKLSRKRKYMRILKSLEIREDDKFVALYPSNEYRVTYRIDFDHPAIRQQEASFAVNPRSFSAEIAPARTFGFLREVELLRRNNLARGGSLENAVILDDHKVINNPLRFADEFVRHKILDAVGDLGFLPNRLIGHMVASRAGHSMHIALVNKLLEAQDHWELIDEPAYERMLMDAGKEAVSLSRA